VLRASFFLAGLVVVACSGNEQASVPAGSTPDGGTTTNGDSGDGAEAGTPIPGDPKKDCPDGFSGFTAGKNTGFAAGGQSRSFELLLPPSSFTGARPILFAFHGTTETGAKFVTRAKLADFVERGFVVVAPDAASNGTIWPVWDAMRLPGKETSPENPDLALFDGLLSCVAAHHSIDASRVFVTGHSAGGIMTNRVLRARSNVVAGGIPASGVFDLTSSGTASATLGALTVIVTWGGDNDTYTGTTPSGVNVPRFSFVEQASLASKHYAAQTNVAHAYCRGANIGHAWLGTLNAWFAETLLAHPKGAKTAFANLPAICNEAPYIQEPLPDMTCGSTARAGCQQACQLFADCAVENRTVGPSLATQLSDIGFTQSSCSGCVSQCQSGATTAADTAALACFAQKQASATCGPGIEGAIPLFTTVNECCKDRPTSNLCKGLCTTILKNEAASAFFPVCASL
jgi:poly(3-hydroxybutyrate) depolymerase